ncbi:MAG: hypothetical protein ACI8TQ_003789 [Planctomycetota bacterium]|jgi:hypothetical protein
MKKALQRTALVLIGLLLAELGWRATLLVVGQSYDADSNREQVAALLGEMGVTVDSEGEAGAQSQTRHTFLHPYVGYETIEGHEATAWQVEYARKFKATQQAEAGQPFTILVLGGSVARIFTDPVKNGGGDAMVNVLETGLQNLNRPIAVLGHGRESFKQPQQVMLLAYFFALGLRPDVVVNLDGFNEVGIGLLNPELGVHPLFPSQTHWSQLLGLNDRSRKRASLFEDVVLIRARARETARIADSANLHASAILGRVIRFSAEASIRRWTQATGRFANSEETSLSNPVSNGLLTELNEQERLALIVDSWVESSSSLNAMCRERGIVYLHVLQPTLHDEGSKKLTEVELEEGAAHPTIERGVRTGYPLMRAAIPRLTDRGVTFLDASNLFRDIEERVYYDLCHFNRPGTEILGEAIGRALVAPITERLNSD